MCASEITGSGLGARSWRLHADSATHKSSVRKNSMRFISHSFCLDAKHKTVAAYHYNDHTNRRDFLKCVLFKEFGGISCDACLKPRTRNLPVVYFLLTSFEQQYKFYAEGNFRGEISLLSKLRTCKSKRLRLFFHKRN
jgi:hypothetical protein